jgi:hypothetical protein
VGFDILKHISLRKYTTTFLHPTALEGVWQWTAAPIILDDINGWLFNSSFFLSLGMLRATTQKSCDLPNGGIPKKSWLAMQAVLNLRDIRQKKNHGTQWFSHILRQRKL